MFTNLTVHHVNDMKMTVRHNTNSKNEKFKVYSLVSKDEHGEEVEICFFVTDDVKVDLKGWE